MADSCEDCYGKAGFIFCKEQPPLPIETINEDNLTPTPQVYSSVNQRIDLEGVEHLSGKEPSNPSVPTKPPFFDIEFENVIKVNSDNFDQIGGLEKLNFGFFNKNGKKGARTVKLIFGKVSLLNLEAEHIFFTVDEQIQLVGSVTGDGFFKLDDVNVKEAALSNGPVYVKAKSGEVFCYEELPPMRD